MKEQVKDTARKIEMKRWKKEKEEKRQKKKEQRTEKEEQKGKEAGEREKERKRYNLVSPLKPRAPVEKLRQIKLTSSEVRLTVDRGNII